MFERLSRKVSPALAITCTVSGPTISAFSLKAVAAKQRAKLMNSTKFVDFRDLLWLPGQTSGAAKV